MDDRSWNDRRLDDRSLVDQADGNVDDLRAHDRNLEEEWISRYRAALQSASYRESWDARLYRIAYRAGGRFAASVQEMRTKIASSQIVRRWMDLVLSSTAASLRTQQRLTAAQPLPAYASQKHSVVALHKAKIKKAG